MMIPKVLRLRGKLETESENRSISASGTQFSVLRVDLPYAILPPPMGKSIQGNSWTMLDLGF